MEGKRLDETEQSRFAVAVTARFVAVVDFDTLNQRIGRLLFTYVPCENVIDGMREMISRGYFSGI